MAEAIALAESNGLIIGGDQLKSAFLQISEDVFVNICNWLSVGDILSLRLANRSINMLTRDTVIWISVLRRLSILLPTLPPIPKYKFGKMPSGSSIYERIMTRALYLEQNWRSKRPFASHTCCNDVDRVISVKMLPGGRFVVTVAENIQTKLYSILVWDSGATTRPTALGLYKSELPSLNLEAVFGFVNNQMSIVIAYSIPLAPEGEGHEGRLEVIVASIPISRMLDEFSGRSQAELDSLFSLNPEEFSSLLDIIHRFQTGTGLSQLALGQFDRELVLLMVCSPKELVFLYLRSTKPQRSRLMFDTGHSILNVKLLTGQRSVLVSRMLTDGAQNEHAPCTINIFSLPEAEVEYKDPVPVSEHIVDGYNIAGVCCSDLESAWFTNVLQPGSLFPSPLNETQPPISIFITTRKPQGFLHLIMRPGPHLPGSPQLGYSLPALEVERKLWVVEDIIPMVLPGAYRSIVWLQSQVGPDRPKELQGMLPTFGVYTTCIEGMGPFSTLRSTGHLCTVITEQGAVTVEEEVKTSASGARETQQGLARYSRGQSSWEILHSDTVYKPVSMAFDESTGRMCFADSSLHILDFGGMTWELGI